MQTAGMLRGGTGAVSLFLALLLVSLIGYAQSYPLQILPSIPGYIPVYIRHGDEPLENINPALAEAFHESPSSKSIRLDASTQAPFLVHEEQLSFLGKSKKKNVYPAPVRQADEDGEQGERNAEANEALGENVPTAHPLGEHRQENGQHLQGAGHGEHSRRKPAPLLREPVAKLSPLALAEKEDLEKLAAQVSKKETSLNDLEEDIAEPFESVAEALKQTDLHEVKDPLDKDLNEEAPMKVQIPQGMFFNVHKLQPIPQPEGESKPTEPNSTAAPVQEKATSPKVEEPVNFPTNIHILPTIAVPDDNAASSENQDEPIDEGPPHKVKPPPNTLSNVAKVSPISAQEISEPAEETGKIKEAPQESTPVDGLAGQVHAIEDNIATDDGATPVKVQHPDEVLSNVLKLTPSPSSEDEKLKSADGDTVAPTAAAEKEQPKEKIATHIHILPTIAVPTNEEHSEDQTADTVGDDEPPVKVQHPKGIYTNVYKLMPIELPEGAKEEIVESRPDDKMKDLTSRNDDIAMD